MNNLSVVNIVISAAFIASVSINPLITLGIAEPNGRDTSDRVLKTVNSVRETVVAEEVQIKKQEIADRITAKRSAVAEKLTGKRAAACKQKEATINTILDNRVDTAQKHFETFRDIRTKLDAFVLEKQLNVENPELLDFRLNLSEKNALAVIEAAKTTSFNCEQADANAPGKIVTELVADQKEALKLYRDAIKEYAIAVKSSVQPVSTTPNDSEPTGGATGE